MMSIVLIACICLFISLSCSYAADIDNATSDNQGTIVLDDDAGISQDMTENQTPNNGTCPMLGSTNSGNENYFTPSLGSDLGWYTDFKHNTSSEFSDSFENQSQMNLENDNAIFDYNYGMDKGFALDFSPKTMTISMKDTFQNVFYDNESLNNIISYEGTTTQSDLHGYEDGHYNHEIISSNRIIDGDYINKDFEHFYNSIYIPLNVVCCEVAIFRDDDENQSSYEVFIFNGANVLNQTEDEDELKGFHSIMDMNLDNCLDDSMYWNLTKFGCIDFDIDMLHCNYLDIKDVYLEYYIFTNPDIISIESLNNNLFNFNTTIFKNSFYHCPAFDLKNTIHLSDVASCIFQDNYVQYIDAYFLEKTIAHYGHFVPCYVFVFVENNLSDGIVGNDLSENVIRDVIESSKCSVGDHITFKDLKEFGNLKLGNVNSTFSIFDRFNGFYETLNKYFNGNLGDVCNNCNESGGFLFTISQNLGENSYSCTRDFNFPGVNSTNSIFDRFNGICETLNKYFNGNLRDVVCNNCNESGGFPFTISQSLGGI